jgi:acyl-homoserine lactone synthase
VIRVIDAHNRHQFNHLLEQQFRLRHDIFVLEKGWSSFDRGAYEMDDYDTIDATYLVSTDDSGTVIGGFRLFPTELPHMLSETFAYMVNGPILRRSDICELTRFAIASQARNSRTYCELFLGLLEHCLSEGISGTTALMRTLRIPIIQSIGMKVVPLGLPQEIDQELQTAVLLEISEDSLALVRRSSNRFESVIDNQTPHRRQIAS